MAKLCARHAMTAAAEARNLFPQQLDRVEPDEEITITRNVRSVGRFVPMQGLRTKVYRALIAEIECTPRGRRLRGLSMRKPFQDGRENRYQVTKAAKA